MSIRERLLARELPSVPYRLTMTDASEARARLAEAETNQRQAVLGRKSAAVRKRCALEVKKAEAAVEACYLDLTVRAIEPLEYEQLLDAHPPTDEQKAKGETSNPTTLAPALIAACIKSDMSEQDWAVFLAKNSSRGEGHELYVTALAVNERARVSDPLMGKGWTPTPS